MDERAGQARGDNTRRNAAERPLHERRRLAADFLSAQRARLQEFESQLASRLNALGEQIAVELQHSGGQAAEAERLREEIARRQSEMEQAHGLAAEDLRAWRERLLQQEAELAAREAECAAASDDRSDAERKQFEAQLAEIESLRRELIEAQEARRKLLAEIEQVQQALFAAQERLAAEAEEANRNRTDQETLARQNEEFAELREQCEKLRVDLAAKEGELSEVLAAFANERAELLERISQLERAVAEGQKAAEQVARLVSERAELQARVEKHEAELALSRQGNEQLIAVAGERDRLASQLADLTERLAQSESQASATLEETQRERDSLRVRIATAEADANAAIGRADELANVESERDQLATELMQVAADLHAATVRGRETADLAARCQTLTSELAAAQAELVGAEQRIAELGAIGDERNQLAAQLEAVESKLHAAAATLVSQRQSFHHERDELQARLAALEAQISTDRERGEGQATQLNDSADRISALTQQVAELLESASAQQLRAEQLAAELQEARQQAERSAQAETKTEAELEAAREADLSCRQRITELEANLAENAAALSASQNEVADLRSRLEAAKAETAPQTNNDDLQRRFELAVDDVRSLKKRNAELEDELSSLKIARVAAPAVRGEDWEAVKRRLMAELEAESDITPSRKQERLTIESTIRITDDLVAKKDREIADLKNLLAAQSDNVGEVAVGAAAIAAAFDQDELIQQERERLRLAQEEWRDKLRQAEIEVSLERARIARAGAELDEKQQTLAAERAAMGGDRAGESASARPNKNEKPTRGRWLTRLGLKDDTD